MSEGITELATHIGEEYAKIDFDGSEKIAFKDIGNLLHNLEIDFTDTQLQEITTKSNIKETDKITFNKFFAVYNSFVKDKHTKEDFIASLKIFAKAMMAKFLGTNFQCYWIILVNLLLKKIKTN